MKQQLRIFLLPVFCTLPSIAFAASFDCTKAATAIEKTICGNESISTLDEQLATAYKQAINASTDKDSLKQQQISWLKTRNQCADATCLTAAYQSRLQVLNSSLVEASTASAPSTASATTTEKSQRKFHFMMKKDTGKNGLCYSYLQVLNRATWDELYGCKLPNLSGSPIQEVKFTPLTGDALKAMDKIVYEQDGDSSKHKDWLQKWPEREKEYATGYRTIGEAYWDLDGDGKPDQIIEDKTPSDICEVSEGGDVFAEQERLFYKWQSLQSNDQLAIAKRDGFHRSYWLVSESKITFVDAKYFLFFKGNHISVNQTAITKKNTRTTWPKDAIWIDISGIDKEKKDVYHNPTPNGQYNSTGTDCEYSLLKD